MNKILLTLVLVLPLLNACNQTTGSKGNLRPTVGVNDAARANLTLAIEYMSRGDYERSLEKLDRARAADPKFSGIYNAYGLLYQLIDRNKDAERYFKKALKLDPNDSNTMNNYGRFLCQIGRSKEAEVTLLKAAENPLYATPEIAITNAGTCAHQEKRLDDAENYFRRALEIDKQNPTALLHMTQLSFDKANYLSARAHLQRYLAVSRPSPGSLWLGIQIEKQLGDKDALSSYALSLRNNYPDSREAGMLIESESRR
ncbi:MAG: type IV pilus assembly protein PilF [Gammaproteobacteria bacterium]|jgi:type IV pilus assembly protein PilF